MRNLILNSLEDIIHYLSIEAGLFDSPQPLGQSTMETTLRQRVNWCRIKLEVQGVDTGAWKVFKGKDMRAL